MILKQSNKTPFKKDLKGDQRLKLCNIHSILHTLVLFNIYQTIYSFPTKRKSLPIAFCKRFLHDSEDSNVSSVIFDVYFDT